MPWDCTGCGTTALLDDEAACPGCGGAKAAWTMHADRTRTFRTTRREKLELLRGTDERAVPQAEGYAPDVALVAAERAVSLPRASARRLAEQGLLPAPAQVLVVRLHPRPGQDPALQTTVLHETLEVVPRDHPREPLQEAGALDAWFVLVHGPEAADDLAFPGLTVLDVTEAALPTGHAPQLGASGLGGRRKDLPIEAVPGADDGPPRGAIHARLVQPDGATVRDAALAWRRDGVAVDGPIDGVTLPARVGPDGVIQVEGLPWASYTVRPAPTGESVPLAFTALPLLRQPDDEPHAQWVRFAGDA